MPASLQIQRLPDHLFPIFQQAHMWASTGERGSGKTNHILFQVLNQALNATHSQTPLQIAVISPSNMHAQHLLRRFNAAIQVFFPGIEAEITSTSYKSKYFHLEFISTKNNMRGYRSKANEVFADLD